MGEVTLAAVNREFQRRYDLGEFVDRRPWRGSAANAYTTPEMVALEHANLAHMKASLGQRQPIDRAFTPAQYDYLNPDQQAAVHRIVTSPDALMALDGVAGSGKTTALVAVREQAERAGFDVYGLAPTSPAAAELAKTGVQTCTLQRFLVADPPVAPGQRERVLFLDESSMVSSEQMRTLQARLRPTDRVILVGDVRQHQAVDAGVPYQQFHGAGLEPAKLSEVVRQQGPGYRRLVHQVARGDVTGALADLTRRGRIHEIQNQSDRFDAIAKRFVQDPVNTLLVSPDNDSRTQLNTIVHTALQANRTVGEDQAPTRVLVTRHAMHGIDRQHADLYEVGDRLRYTKGSKVYGITPGEYATVTAADRAMNTLTVQRSDGSTLAYDPSRLHCVGVFEPQERAFAVGERVQFTCPDRTLRVTNRQRGTITDLDATQATIRLDAGRTVRVDLTQPAHLDYGYCTTSYSSQSLTAEKVILHVDSAHAHSELVNRRLCYVAFSRGQRELQVYTDDSKMLERSLNRDVSKRQAIEPPRHELGMAV
jgi:ATP-dependent exoDNAse (exonuclease V) alpha subunit